MFEGLASVFIQRATVTMWLLGMAYATLHYVVPRAVLQPLASGGVALLTFLTWLALAPASALATLVDVSVPVPRHHRSARSPRWRCSSPPRWRSATWLATMQGRWSVLFGTGAGALAAVSLVFLLGTSLLESIGALREVRAFVGRTDWVSGLFIWSAFGTFTFAALALGDHAMPRILKRAWGGGMASAACCG